MRCEICGKLLKENTEGKKGYCQGHDYSEVEKWKKEK